MAIALSDAWLGAKIILSHVLKIVWSAQDAATTGRIELVISTRLWYDEKAQKPRKRRNMP
jgi:hypothetical protein